MKKLITAILLVAASAGGALAASVTNKDSSPVVLVIVENGNRMEVAVDAGSTQTICPGGCFVTLPNGDRIGLEGKEQIDIVNGAANIR